MLHHHCVTADPQWACNVFSRVICGSSQSRATLDVSHGHFRVGYKSAGLILDGAYNAAPHHGGSQQPDAFLLKNDELRYSYERLLLLSNGSVCQDENSWGYICPSLGRTASIVSKSHWPPCDDFHGVSEAFRSLRIPNKLKLK